MKLIHNNPYRVAGVLSNATEKELQSQKGRIMAYARIGRETDSEYDFGILERISRAEVPDVVKAFSAIQQNPDKVSNSLFWFLNASPFDNTAIEYLKKGNPEKAAEIWDKVTQDKDVTSKNFSAFNNLGTYKLLSKSEDEIKTGIEAKIKLIESDNFKDFVYAVADETSTIDYQKQIEKLVVELLAQFKNQYSSSETLALFSNCNGSTQKYLSKKFTEEPIYTIESQIESTKDKRKENKSDAYGFGLSLYRNTKKDLSLLKSLLGTQNLKYKMIADNLANEVMQCGIDYFKARKESKDPSAEGLKLLKYAKSIAVGSQTKDRVKENIEGIDEYSKRVIIKTDLEAIAKLLDDTYNDKTSPPLSEKTKDEVENIFEGLNVFEGLKGLEGLGDLSGFLRGKNTIEKAEKLIKQSIPHLINIKSVLKEDNELYISLSTSIVAKAQNYIIETINAAQQPIGMLYPRVDIPGLKAKLKEVWKVTQLIDSLDTTYQFKENFQNNKHTLENLCIQLDLSTPNYNYGRIPQLSFIITGSEITNTDENDSSLLITEPLYDKYIRYIGLNLKILSYGTQTINFFLKYVEPHGRYKTNSNSSLEGYTKWSEQTITSNAHTINFEGWGNSEKSSHKIGDNSIEVWVDNFMICKKEFTIDLSPSQKIEKKIKNAENKLNEINETNYFISEISSARNEMSEINKFKLFRGSSDKQDQIQYQHAKIYKLVQKAKEEKKKNIRTEEEKIYKLKMELSTAKY